MFYSFIIEFLASFLVWFLFAGLLILWAIDGKIRKETVLHALVASLVAWVIAQVIKKIIPIARPFAVNGGEILTLTLPSDNAFPSGHAALAFALATTIWLHDRKIGWLYLILAAVVGAARVLANVHYPVDILGGSMVGILTSFAVERLHVYQFLTRKKG